MMVSNKDRRVPPPKQQQQRSSRGSRADGDRSASEEQRLTTQPAAHQEHNDQEEDDDVSNSSPLQDMLLQSSSQPHPSEHEEHVNPTTHNGKPLTISLSRKPQQITEPAMPPLRPRSPLECDYDKSPTDLYKSLERREWNAIVERLEDETESEFRQQASIWVIRKEPSGKLRWRLLPLHAALVLGAPAAVTEAVLEANANAASQKDDQGMLPLHLAFRNFEKTEYSVIQELLTAYPNAVQQRDRKNRTPLAAGLLANPNSTILPVIHLYSTIVAAGVRSERHQSESDQHTAELHKLQVLHEQRLRQLREECRQQSSNTVPDDVWSALSTSLQLRKELYEKDAAMLAAHFGKQHPVVEDHQRSLADILDESSIADDD